ncbi:hypothetical protein [Vibrio sp. AND4]|uniref:hypothetical protein n=1 Tax=Vibrio sp. AND4 TaxID=314289 RepID=UPI00015EFE93|nr:hypothetical protein [Vibrio sp. AND4]EDP59468.1 hypothetical protein AND4_09852 [Vibrio sp. AND4]
MISRYPFGSQQELKVFMIVVEDKFIDLQDRNLLASSFKLIFFLKLMVEHNHNINHKRNINGAIYDSLNGIVSIFNSRERYLYLNLRSLIEHIARIALDKRYGSKDFDCSVRRNDFLYLKSEVASENWKYMHETYSRACHYIHASPKVNLNINATFTDLLYKDSTSTQSKQIRLFQKVLSETIKIFISYYYIDISNTFFRAQWELKFLLGNNLYKEYKKMNNH